MSFADNGMDILFFFATLVLNHQSLGTCYRMTTRYSARQGAKLTKPQIADVFSIYHHRMTRGVYNLPPPTVQIRHHIILIACNLGWDIISNVQPLMLGGRHSLANRT